MNDNNKIKSTLVSGFGGGQMDPFVSEEADLAQWLSGPRLLGPSIAERMIQRGKATKAQQSSENNPPV